MLREVIAKVASLIGCTKAIILPGNGAGDVTNCMWYPWLANQLEEHGIPTILTNFPDPVNARESIWKPFVCDVLQADENTILIGHSSGAACSMRILEECKVLGVVLVSAYHTDMGDPLEAASGYFNRSWNWDAMKQNASFIGQFHGTDDHLVPLSDGRKVKSFLGCDYQEIDNVGHFQVDEVPQILSYILKKTNQEQEPDTATLTQDMSNVALNNNAPVLVTPSKLRGMPPKTVNQELIKCDIPQFKDLQSNKWTNFGKERKDAKIRLYCFPYNAGGPTIYRTWPDMFPFAEVIPVTLPGHGPRGHEEPVSDLKVLVEQMAEGLFPSDKPFAFFGYSMGAMLALELAVYVRNHLGLEPKAIVVAAEAGPQFLDVSVNPSTAPRKQLEEYIKRDFKIPPEIASDAEMFQSIVKLISADLMLESGYKDNYSVSALSCPVTAFWGDQDHTVSQQAARNWSVTTKGKFEFHIIENADHMFINTNKTFTKQVVNIIEKLV